MSISYKNEKNELISAQAVRKKCFLSENKEI